jgi:type III secretory pathway lipoprotein EscJ
MNLTPEQIDVLLQRLQEANPEAPALTSEERQAVREILQAWRMWQAWGVLGRAFLWILMTAAAAVVAWKNLKGEMASWFG